MSPYRAHLYNRNSRDNEPSSLARGAVSTIKLTAFLTIAGMGLWLFFHSQVRSRLCATVEQKCNCALSDTGIETSIESAQFFDGRGMLLSNMQARAPHLELTAYETFLRMPSNTTDLVTGQCRVEGV